MIKYNILSYNDGSQSARNIAQSLQSDTNNTMRINHGSARWRRLVGAEAPRDQHVVAFWGNVHADRELRNSANILLLNNVDKTNYTNKGAFFARFALDRNLSLPWWTMDIERAREYAAAMPNRARPKLVERQVLTGHSGQGILLLNHGDIPTANGRLWTEYVPKKDEYRVHFFKGLSKLVVQQKKLRTGFLGSEGVGGDTVFKVRNHHNGWVYCREDVNPPQCVLQQAVNFRDSSLNQLDFGAIDILYNESRDTAYILEVNTAPGVTGQTANDYRDAFKEYAANHNWRSTTYTRAA